MLMIRVTMKICSMPITSDKISNTIIMQLSNHQNHHTPICLKLLLVFIVSICLKMTLVPAYYSTDQDVHQNWLRITATQPITSWYFDVQMSLIRPKANGH